MYSYMWEFVKKLLMEKVLLGLRIWELILYGLQLLLLTLVFVSDMLFVTFRLEPYMSIAVIIIIILIARKVSLNLIE